MIKILATDHHKLKKGDVIVIEDSIEVVTNVLNHTFYSAPIFKEGRHEGDRLRKSSHWAGQFNYDDEIVIFEGIEEALSFLRDEYNLLIEYYIG